MIMILKMNKICYNDSVHFNLHYMTTKIISLKDYRHNITSLWKESQKDNIRYIVLHHSKPVLDVRPFREDELVFEGDIKGNEINDYYQTLEQNLDFWKSEKDDDIFLTK